MHPHTCNMHSHKQVISSHNLPTTVCLYFIYFSSFSVNVHHRMALESISSVEFSSNPKCLFLGPLLQ